MSESAFDRESAHALAHLLLTPNDITRCRREIQKLRGHLKSAIMEIDRLQVANKVFQTRFVDMFIGKRCPKHSGENTPPLPEFIETIEKNCLFCLIEENQKQVAEIAKLELRIVSLQEALGKILDANRDLAAKHDDMKASLHAIEAGSVGQGLRQDGIWGYGGE